MALFQASKSSRRRKINEITQKIRNFQPSSEFIEFNNMRDRVIIGLFGGTGAGKSSVINSMLSLLRGADFTPAQVGSSTKKTGCSLFRTRFKLTNVLYLVDNRGMDKIGKEVVRDEILAQLDGKRGYATEVIPEQKGIDVVGDRLHVAILVVNGNWNYSADDYKPWEELILLFKRRLGRSPLVVITHADDAKKDSLYSTNMYLKSIGIDSNDVIEVANKTTERNKLMSSHKLALLNFIVRCTREAEAVEEFRAQRTFDSAAN